MRVRLALLVLLLTAVVVDVVVVVVLLQPLICLCHPLEVTTIIHRVTRFPDSVLHVRVRFTWTIEQIVAVREVWARTLVRSAVSTTAISTDVASVASIARETSSNVIITIIIFPAPVPAIWVIISIASTAWRVTLI